MQFNQPGNKLLSINSKRNTRSSTSICPPCPFVCKYKRRHLHEFKIANGVSVIYVGCVDGFFVAKDLLCPSVYICVCVYKCI